MRRILPALLLAACVPAQPATMLAPAGPDALKCAASRMTALGYTVQGETSNTVRAEQRSGNLVTTLTAATFDDQLRVETQIVSHYGDGQQMQVGATKYTRADAQAVLDACGRR